jgi:adenylate kinase family enzyme
MKRILIIGSGGAGKSTLARCLSKSYEIAGKVSWRGMQFRKDIGK